MTGLSRRDALMGATAAAIVTTATVAPLALKASGVKAALAGDAVLLARVAQFHETYEAAQRAWERQQSHRARIEAMPGCPVARIWHAGDTEDGRPTWRERDAFLEEHDAYKYYDECNSLWNQTGEFANALFETPSQTTKGALEKLKIAYTAAGDGEGTDTGDIDLQAFQDLAAPWMESVIADLERLSGEAQI